MENEAVLIFIAFAAFFVIAGFVLFLSFRAEKNRTENWRSLAHDINFSFTEENDSLLGTYSNFKVFNKGHSQSIKNVLSGKNGDVDIEVFDYRYVTGSGKNRSVTNLSICIMTVPNFSFPNWFLRQEYFLFDYLGKMFGGQDINFDEDPEFSKSFVLQGYDEQAVRRLFTPDIRRGFLDFRSSLSCIEAQDNMIVIQQPRRKAKEMTKLLEDAYKVRDIFS